MGRRSPKHETILRAALHCLDFLSPRTDFSFIMPPYAHGPLNSEGADELWIEPLVRRRRTWPPGNRPVRESR